MVSDVKNPQECLKRLLLGSTCLALPRWDAGQSLGSVNREKVSKCPQRLQVLCGTSWQPAVCKGQASGYSRNHSRSRYRVQQRHVCQGRKPKGPGKTYPRPGLAVTRRQIPSSSGPDRIFCSMIYVSLAVSNQCHSCAGPWFTKAPY